MRSENQHLHALMPDCLRFKTAVDLVRVGKNHDGGYLIPESDIERSEVLLSLGINDDWSFETDFHRYRNAPVFAFDASVNQRFFFQRVLKTSLRLDRTFVRALKSCVTYGQFFRGSRVHVMKFVANDQVGDSFISMTEVLQYTSSNRIFLKIDIEGSEYSILHSVLKQADRLTGLAIEFHDCELHLDEICEFVQAFELGLVHVHGNNYGAPASRLDVPHALELTFSRDAETLPVALQPHPLDQPNNRRLAELVLDCDRGLLVRP